MSALYSGPIAFAKAIVTAMKADTTLNAAMTAAFPGKVLKYFVGLDDAALPSSDDCPHIGFMPGNYQTRQMSGVRLAEKDCNLSCSLVIACPTKTVTADMVVLDGYEKLETLTPLAIKSMQPKVLALGKYGKFGPINTEIAYPLFRATWTIEAVDEY
jgi:hypothetical protein